MKAEALFRQFCGSDDVGPIEDYLTTLLPTVAYDCIPLIDLPIENPKGCDLAGSVAWYPRGSLETLKRLRIQVLSHSPNCVLYFLRNAPSMMVKLNGPGHSILNLTRNKFAMKVRMTGGDGETFKGCKVLVGEGSFAGGIDAILLNTDLIIKKQSLWSDGILVQGSNQHGVVDRATMDLVDYGRNRIELEPHVWIGRRAVLTSGAHIGAGSIVGTAAVATKVYPASCIVAGNPGRIIKRNMTWANSLLDVGEVERDIIEQYTSIVPKDPPQTWVDKAQSLARSMWIKAVAAGAIGAAAFEAIQELAFSLD